MDIENLKDCKANREHALWKELCNEAKQNLITGNQKEKKIEFKCFSPKTEIEGLFDKNKDPQNLKNVVSRLEKLANLYLCLHRYAINLINKKKEGNLEVIKVIKVC